MQKHSRRERKEAERKIWCFRVGYMQRGERERRGSGRWSVTFLSPLPFCAVAARGTRRYDDINLTCTRMHCYDNVFKCQPVGTSKRERWSGTHTSARAVSFRADVSTRANPTNPRHGLLSSSGAGFCRRCSWPATCLRNRVSDIIPCRETNCYFISHLLWLDLILVRGGGVKLRDELKDFSNTMLLM